MVIKQFLFVGFIFFLLTSCKKYESNGNGYVQPEQPVTHAISDPDLVDFKFKPGTYWVYIDSVTNLADSVSVESFSLDSLVLAGYEPEDYYHHHIFSTLSYPSMQITQYAVQPFGVFKGFSGSINSGQRVYVGYDVSYYANCLSDTIGTMFIFDQFYTDVVRIEVGNDATENNNRSFYYINSEFGFLRHDIYSGSNLISQKILMNKNIVR